MSVACFCGQAVFAPGELATPGFFYVIHKGVALYGGRVLTSGKVWRADGLLKYAPKEDTRKPQRVFSRLLALLPPACASSTAAC